MTERKRIPAMKQGSAEWHEHREKHMNASEAGAVLGVAPFLPSTPYQLARVKRGDVSVPVTKAMRVGSDLEPVARAHLEKVHGIDFEPAVYVRGRYSASLDGIDMDGTEACEIKIPNSGVDSPLWKSVDQSGEPPVYYMAQMAHQWYCSGVERIYLYVYVKDAPEKSKLLEVEAEKLEKFWETKLGPAWAEFLRAWDAGTNPAPSPGDTIEHHGTEVTRVAEEIVQLSRVRDELDAGIEALKAELINLVKPSGCNALIPVADAGARVRVTFSTRQGSIQWKKVPLPDDVDPEDYRGKPSKVTTVKIEPILQEKTK